MKNTKSNEVYVLCKETPDGGKQVFKVVDSREKAEEWVNRQYKAFLRRSDIPFCYHKPRKEDFDIKNTLDGKKGEFEIYWENDSYGWYAYRMAVNGGFRKIF